jgi:hypothetical protein
MKREVKFPLSQETDPGFASAVNEIKMQFSDWKIVEIRRDEIEVAGEKVPHGIIVVEWP